MNITASYSVEWKIKIYNQVATCYISLATGNKLHISHSTLKTNMRSSKNKNALITKAF